MNKAERVAVETALRRMLGNTQAVSLEPSERDGMAELHCGRTMVGTVEAVDDEDGRSWAVSIAILPSDLAL